MRLYEMSMLIEDRIATIRQKFDARLRQKEPNIEPATIIDKAIDSDPTKNKQYIQWLLINYLKGNVELEDMYKTKGDLSDFERLKGQLGNKDINQYTPDSLFRTIKDLHVTTTKRQEKQQIKTEGTDIIAKGKDGVLLKLKTKEAACYYGRETRWCTAATSSNNMFDDYNSTGPIYVFMANDGLKFQFWMDDESMQFMNKDDNPVNPREIAKQYPTLVPFVKKIEKTILDNPTLIIEYCTHVIGTRWPEAEDRIMDYPHYAYGYAASVIKGRWPEAETGIADDALNAYWYAKEVIKGRFPDAEDTIARNSRMAFQYARDVLKGRFPEGEAAIAPNPTNAYWYAAEVLEARFPAGEKAIASDAALALWYAREVVKGRWPEGEEIIATTAADSYKYATMVINDRFPAGEKAIAASPKIASMYKRDVLNKEPLHGLGT